MKIIQVQAKTKLLNKKLSGRRVEDLDMELLCCILLGIAILGDVIALGLMIAGLKLMNDQNDIGERLILWFIYVFVFSTMLICATFLIHAAA